MKLPQLSLRELFLLVALVAMGCGWWVERGRLLADSAAGKKASAQESELRMTLEREGLETLREPNGQLSIMKRQPPGSPVSESPSSGLLSPD